MSRSETYRADLLALVELLREKPRTALALAELTKCSKPTVYARLCALSERGYELASEPCREGSRGPEALAYRLVREPPAQPAAA